ncbi:MAG: hypothetical protein HKN18_10190 [Silicimonas sp.]|nr:hypothetical protein [Silicimonas sp.]
MKKHSRLASWLILGLYVLQLGGAIALGHYVLQGEVTFLGGLAVAVLMLFVATRLRGLNNIIHECSHATFSENRADNTTIGRICASLLFNSFDSYRHEHLSHHAHLGDYEQDLDLQGIEDLGLHDPLSPSVVARHLTTPLLLRHLPYYLSLNLSSRDGRFFQIFQFVLVAFVTFVTAVAPLTGLLMMIVPFVFIFTTLNYWADCMDHAGLVPTDDELDGSRNILAPRAVRWLFFPRNDCFHLVHHLFPHVPARHLETSHTALLDDELYLSRANAVRKPRETEGVGDGMTITPAE